VDEEHNQVFIEQVTDDFINQHLVDDTQKESLIEASVLSPGLTRRITKKKPNFSLAPAKPQIKSLKELMNSKMDSLDTP